MHVFLSMSWLILQWILLFLIYIQPNTPRIAPNSSYPFQWKRLVAFLHWSFVSCNRTLHGIEQNRNTYSLLTGNCGFILIPDTENISPDCSSCSLNPEISSPHAHAIGILNFDLQLSELYLRLIDPCTSFLTPWSILCIFIRLETRSFNIIANLSKVTGPHFVYLCFFLSERFSETSELSKEMYW